MSPIGLSHDRMVETLRQEAAKRLHNRAFKCISRPIRRAAAVLGRALRGLCFRSVLRRRSKWFLAVS